MTTTNTKPGAPAGRDIDVGVMAFHPDDPMHMPCYESRHAR
jgi:hypothetical protein